MFIYFYNYLQTNRFIKIIVYNLLKAPKIVLCNRYSVILCKEYKAVILIKFTSKKDDRMYFIE